jgi:hypothetical protein
MKSPAPRQFRSFAAITENASQTRYRLYERTPHLSALIVPLNIGSTTTSTARTQHPSRTHQRRANESV